MAAVRPTAVAARTMTPCIPPARQATASNVSASHSWANQGRVPAVNENGSIAGMAWWFRTHSPVRISRGRTSQIHRLGPGRHEVVNKGRLQVVTGQRIRQRPSLELQTRRSGRHAWRSTSIR